MKRTQVKETKTINNMYESIFDYLNVYLTKNPLNYDTQKNLEIFLRDQYIGFFSNKKDINILGINLSSNMFSSKLKNIIIDKIEEMDKYINKIKQENELLIRLGFD